MKAKSHVSPEDWISFEAAGRLIDGQAGWTFDHINKTRPRAEALVKFACDGVLRIRAAAWTFREGGEEKAELTDGDYKKFLFMLFQRVKKRSDRIEYDSSIHGEIEYRFEIADDINGHYDALMVRMNRIGQREVIQQFKVIGLKFCFDDVSSLFQLSSPKSDGAGQRSLAIGGRPTAADWEGAAIEMARRFYLGDLKPRKVVDVQTQLTDWLAERDVHPGQTALREHAKRYFEAFSTWEAE